MQRLTGIGVFSLAKIMAMIGLVVGLLVGVIYGMLIMAMGAAGGVSAEEGGAGIAAIGVGGGIAVMIIAPLFYSVISFIAGLIYGLILNIVLSLSGGLELRFEPAK